MGDTLTEVKFWQQVIGDSERTIICSPENESRIKTWMAARALDGRYTVQVSRHVADDRVLMIDEQAIAASTVQASQHGVRYRW